MSLKNGNARVVFVGDSITGLGRNMGCGFAHLMEAGLKATYPDAKPGLVALGGSGQGVRSWLSVEKSSRAKERMLDVKNVPVKANLDRPADVLVVMLGMNDVLAPYIAEDKASLGRWREDYRKLVEALRARVQPGTIALATATPCTEDPKSPKNRLLAEMNRKARSLAEELGALVIPTNQAVWKVLEQGRKLERDFHVTYDFVHPNEAGQTAIAVAMLRGLGEPEAAEWLEKGRLARVLAAAAARLDKAVTPANEPAPWLVAAKLVQPCWVGNRFLADKARTPIDEAIGNGKDFTRPIDVGKGRILKWQPYVPSVNYTGLDAPGSVDFAAVTHAANFEGGYGVRWIRSDKERPVTLHLGSNVFAGVIHLTVWLNGRELYSGMITGEPKQRATLDACLVKGWNTLAFKANHRTWQWQVFVKVVPVGDDALEDLHYQATFPVPPSSAVD